jgi:methionyl-tRNA formyltransferase
VTVRPLSVAFLGNDAWSVPSLEAVARSAHRVALVLTYPPRPAGRGSEPRPTPVAEAARSMGLPLVEADSARGGRGRIALTESAPDVLVVVAYGELLTGEVLAAGRLGAVNVHFSLLPALRGASPVQHALLSGMRTTGVTTMLMDEGLDTGPVLLQAGESIRDDDDAGSLGSRLARAGAALLVETLDRLSEGTLDPIDQDHSAATRAPKLGADDRRLDWAVDATSIVNRVRALAPRPAAVTTFRGRGLKVFRASRVEGSGEPGAVVTAGEGGLCVAAGEGAVRLLEVGPAGRRRMSGDAFVRGFRPEPGDRIG